MKHTADRCIFSDHKVFGETNYSLIGCWWI
jgi:hypothetical protein